MRERTLTVDGMDLRLATVGDGDPVVFVHGLGGAWTSWRPSLRVLPEGLHAVAPTLPGFGRSAKPQRDYTPVFFADTLASLLDELGIESATVVGSSLGGHVTLELALGHPERVDRVLTVAPAGVPPAQWNGSPALATYTRILDAQTESDVVEILEAITPEGIEPPDHGREAEEILAYVNSPGAEQAFFSALRESARARRVGPLLDEIDAPSLVAWGKRDPMLPWNVVEPVLAEAKRPGLVLFPEAGHSPHNHRPELFRDLLAAFRAGNLEPLVQDEPQLRMPETPQPV